MSSAIIKLDQVTKEFRLGQGIRLGDSLKRTFQRLQGRPVEDRRNFRAVEDVNLEIGAGEIVGIVGHNGAGKSTLLKLISRIIVPTYGKVRVRGRVSPLIEVGAGLIQDMTGRENIFLNGSILGMTKSEIRRKFDEIVEFAELAEFIDTPLKKYSSGMQIRLGFSVATSVESEVLLIDEVLAVGDVAFQRKCLDRVDRMISKGDRTILIVGHNIRQIERMCNRVVMLERGHVKMDGEPTDVCGAFLNATQARVNAQEVKRIGTVSAEVVTGHLHVGQVDVRAVQQRELSRGLSGAVEVDIDFEALESLEDIEIVLGIHTPDLLYLTEMTSMDRGFRPSFLPGNHRLCCRFDQINLRPGAYGIGLSVYDRGGRCLWRGNGLHPFVIEQSSPGAYSSLTRGMVDTPCAWSLEAPAQGAVSAVERRARVEN